MAGTVVATNCSVLGDGSVLTATGGSGGSPPRWGSWIRLTLTGRGWTADEPGHRSSCPKNWRCRPRNVPQTSHCWPNSTYDCWQIVHRRMPPALHAVQMPSASRGSSHLGHIGKGTRHAQHSSPRGTSAPHSGQIRSNTVSRVRNAPTWRNPGSTVEPAQSAFQRVAIADQTRFPRADGLTWRRVGE
jgi:hypothetical protein